jgi:hypothetical protein
VLGVGLGALPGWLASKAKAGWFIWVLWLRAMGRFDVYTMENEGT